MGYIDPMLRTPKLFLFLALELALFGPGLIYTSHVDRGAKTLDQYWQETDLTGAELEDLLDEKICYNDRVSYLACASAVLQVAEKLGYVVELNGQLRELERSDVAKRLTEKTTLQPWSDQWISHNVMRSPTFRELWHRLELINTKPQIHSTLVATGMNGYLSIAKDPHSYIIPLAYYDEVVSRSDARAGSLGFIVRRAQDRAIVRKIFESSPASVAGLRKGDNILRINGVEVSAMLPNVFTEALKLKDGDRLSLLIERWDHDKRSEKYLEVIRSDYVTPSVSAAVLEGPRKLGLLTLNKFAHESCNQVKEQVVSLQEQGISGLLLDLRDNPGGQVEEAACILNLFVPKGKLLFETRYLDLNRQPDRYVTERNAIYSGPLAVLINSGSASASEIVSGSLKDLGRATLVGERTFGKGTFQDGRLWGSHAKVAVFETEGMYYFPSGWTPQVVGIEPDIQVEFTDLASHREAELFYNPILPKDLWAGPQSLTWLQMMQCQDDPALWENYGEHYGDDTQVLKAREWLSCRHQMSGQAGDVL